MEPVTTYTDAQLLQDFRDLFRLTLDEVEGTGISRSTCARIEQGIETTHRPGVEKRLVVIRRLMDEIGRMPYREARAWAVRPLPRKKETPRDIVAASVFGLNTALQYLAARHDAVFG
jgi:hypothetical protein